MPLPPDGLVLSRKLAEVLGAKLGDPVVVEVLDGRRPFPAGPRERHRRRLHGHVGLHGDRRPAAPRRRRIDRSRARSFASIRPRWIALYRRLKDTPMVAGVSLKRSAIDSFQKTLADTFTS